MTKPAQPLQIGLIVRAARRNRYDVINVLGGYAPMTVGTVMPERVSAPRML